MRFDPFAARAAISKSRIRKRRVFGGHRTCAEVQDGSLRKPIETNRFSNRFANIGGRRRGDHCSPESVVRGATIAARERTKGHGKEEVERAVGQAARDVCFLFNLQSNFNEGVLHGSQFLLPTIAFLARLPPAPPLGRGQDAKRAADRRRNWRSIAMSVFAELHICGAMTKRLSETYFAGYAVLYPQAADDLDWCTQTLGRIIELHDEDVWEGARRLTKQQKAALIDLDALKRAAEALVPDMLSRAANGARAHTLQMMDDGLAAMPFYRAAVYGAQTGEPPTDNTMS